MIGYSFLYADPLSEALAKTGFFFDPLLYIRPRWGLRLKKLLGGFSKVAFNPYFYPNIDALSLIKQSQWEIYPLPYPLPKRRTRVRPTAAFNPYALSLIKQAQWGRLLPWILTAAGLGAGLYGARWAGRRLSQAWQRWTQAQPHLQTQQPLRPQGQQRRQPSEIEELLSSP